MNMVGMAMQGCTDIVVLVLVLELAVARYSALVIIFIYDFKCFRTRGAHGRQPRKKRAKTLITSAMP
jgi:hypothetical protein